MTQSTQPVLLPDDHLASLKSIEDGYWWYSGRLYWSNQVVRLWKKLNPGKVLSSFADVGCGTGGFAKRMNLTHKFKNVFLVDADKATLDSIDKTDNMQTLQTNLEAPFQFPEKVDLISCMDVIEHLEHDEHALHHLFENMTPGGLLLLTVPAMPSLYSYWDYKLGHRRRYTKKELTQKIEAAGFQIFHTRYMWSALVAAGPYRKWVGSSKKSVVVEFPKTPAWMNALLSTYAKIEWHISKFLPLPFGTSLIVGATKR